MKIVIRAGGVGARLWPMSRRNHPKQFQAVVGEQTMVRQTYERIKDLAPTPADIFVSVNLSQLTKLQQEVPELPLKNIIQEPTSRNTGPAICLETAWLEKICRPDEIVASIPADDYISDAAAFGQLLIQSAAWLKDNPDWILTPGVRPTYADTGYSYIKIGDKLHDHESIGIFQASDWVEKPNEEVCAKLVKSGLYYCHAGMYIWQLGAIAKLFDKLQPAMYQVCKKVINEPKVATDYNQLEKMTIESAITHKCDKVALAISDKIGWSDLGKWHILKRLLAPAPDNLFKGQIIGKHSNNNLVYHLSGSRDKPGTSKLVVLNQVNNLVIVDTDDVLLVSDLERSADIKEILEQLKQEGKEKYL